MRILLVEDNERLGELIAAGLSRAGMTVDRLVTARDGAAALATMPWLEDALYGLDDDVSSNSIEVAAHRLRKRLQSEGASVHIHTLREVGYMMQT